MTPLLCAHHSVVWDVIDGAVTVCNLEDGIVHRLNPVGGLVWITGLEADADYVLARVCERHNSVGTGLVEADIRYFVADLHDRNLVAKGHGLHPGEVA